MFTHKIAAVAMVSALLVPSTAFAAQPARDITPYSRQITSDSSGTATSPDGQRSIKQIEGRGLELGTQEGDAISIDRGLATWKDASGSVVAQITLTAKDDENIAFAYDPATHRIAPL